MILKEKHIIVVRMVVKRWTNIKVYDWVQQVEQLGAGELLVTSMGHDGMKQGFDIEHLANIKSLVNIPIIASGGGGNAQHFVDYLIERMFLQV